MATNLLGSFFVPALLGPYWPKEQCWPEPRIQTKLVAEAVVHMANLPLGANIAFGGVLHKTFVEADEAGTTAAAVTGIQMRATAMLRPQEEFNLVFDHPFVTAIVDGTSGAILFLGIVGEP